MKDRDRIIASMGELAGSYFAQGYCCAEAVLKATMETFSVDLSSNVIRLATGFCGGMGIARGPCGIFSGGIMALGIFVGRLEPDESDESARSLVGAYVKRLEREAQGFICEDLLEGIWYRKLRKSGCKNLTVKGAEVLADIVLEHDLAASLR